MTVQTLKAADQELVVLTRKEFDELMEKAGVLPPLPPADERGYRPALETVAVHIARSLISDRIRVGLTQKELARRAGVRLETVCRIESGKQKPSRETILRLDKAIKAAEAA